jgi:hypothetical protein
MNQRHQQVKRGQVIITHLVAGRALRLLKSYLYEEIRNKTPEIGGEEDLKKKHGARMYLSGKTVIALRKAIRQELRGKND